MTSKSQLKKNLILKKAREVFIKKGYKDVTMTDIVSACEISRGGLYRYYKNTGEIFLQVLYMDQGEIGCKFAEAIEGNRPAYKILEVFLQEQKRELLNKDDNLTVAVYEFFSINKNKLEENILKKRFNMAVEIISKLIQYGIDRKEFNPVDKATVSKHIILLLEGIRLSSEVMEIGEELVDEQLGFIKEILIHESKR